VNPINPSRRALALLGLLAITSLTASAATKTGKNKSKGKGKSTSRKKDPSILSEAERRKLEEARLTRECRGRPNAGACLGYAH
jgi:hypothetical protein